VLLLLSLLLLLYVLYLWLLFALSLRGLQPSRRLTWMSSRHGWP